MTPLLAWSQDDFLAQRSGYHVLADYLDAPRVATHRGDPSGGASLLFTRLLRRFSLSRWYTGGSAKMEREVWARCRAGFSGPVHLLWCDRDIGFLDVLLTRSQNPLIGTFHHPPAQLDQIFRHKKRLHRLRAFILMSQTQKEWFLSQGISDERLHVILHGVDIEYFKPIERTESSAETQFLSVGQTGRDFGMLKQLASHFEGHPTIRFRIIGPDHEAARFSHLNGVQFETRISDEALLRAYQDADALLHLTTSATANNVLVEALACGTPVIANRVGGVPEYLNESCSMLGPAGSEKMIRDAIVRFSADLSLQRSMRNGARSHAETLSWTRVAARTRAIQESCVSRLSA
jgi:glycosyltransferase involved in cell wall biosynthesis